MSNADKPRKGFRAFWTTLPGLLTAVAGLLTAIAAIAGLFFLPNSSSDGAGEHVTHAEWVHRADLLCSRTAELVRGLPPVEATTLIRDLSAVTSAQRDLAEKLRAMEAPEEDQPSISRYTTLLDVQRNEADAAIVAAEEGRVAVFRHRILLMESFEKKINEAARSLGLDACAQRITPVGASSF